MRHWMKGLRCHVCEPMPAEPRGRVTAALREVVMAVLMNDDEEVDQAAVDVAVAAEMHPLRLTAELLECGRCSRP